MRGDAPLKEQLAAFSTCFIILGPFLCWPVALWLAWASWWTRVPLLTYVAWYLLIDKRSERPGGAAPLRHLTVWKLFAKYFNAKLVKTAALSPNKRYLICGHPHGVCGFSYSASFLTEGTNFSQTFPGITVYPTVLASHFSTPFHREVALGHRIRSCSKASLLNILNGAPGNAAFLLAGGAPEALLSLPGTYDVILKERYGFVRIALRTGASLVPVIAFGETDVYDVVRPAPGSWKEAQQKLLLRYVGFGIPSFTGTGFFTETGVLPKHVQLTTVVGAPVEVPKMLVSDPDFNNAMMKYHAAYVAALQSLWDAHKDTYAKKRRKSLTIM